MIVFIMKESAAAIKRNLPQQQQRLLAYRVVAAAAEFVEVKFLRLVTVSETNFNIDLAAR